MNSLRAVLLGTVVLVCAMHSHVHADALTTIRMCESNGNYSEVSSNGLYFGAYQFSLATWQFVGGSGYPHEASPTEQDERALYLLTHYGEHHWPVCGKGVTGT